MNVEKLIWGLAAILFGLFGLYYECGKSARENKERGWNSTRLQAVIGIWSSLIAGTSLVILGLIGGD